MNNENLLANHPDGLGKHISVREVGEHTVDVTVRAQSALSIWSLPVLIVNNDSPSFDRRVYYVEISSDITCGATASLGERYHKDAIILMDEVVDVVNHPTVSWYLDQVYSFLGFRKEAITLHLMAKKTNI